MSAHLKNAVRTFFSKDITKGLASVVGSKTAEGFILAGVYAIAFALSIALVIQGLLKTVTNTLLASLGGLGSLFGGSNLLGVNFGSLFGLSLLGIIIALALLALGAFIVTKLSKVDTVSFISLVNLIGYSCIPVALACLANILLSFIWTPLCIVTFFVAVLMQGLLMYIGIQRLGKVESTYIIWFSVVIGIAFVISAAICLSFCVNSITDAVSSLASDTSDMVGDIFSSLL